MHHSIIYLACPYSSPSMEIRIQRFDASAHAAAELIRRGKFVYSPITMTHPIDLVLAEEGGSMGSDYWCDFDEAFMAVCEEMVILAIPGWEASNGIRREIEFFQRHNKSIRYMFKDDAGSYQIVEQLHQSA